MKTDEGVKTYTVEHPDGRVLRGITEKAMEELKDGIITFDELYSMMELISKRWGEDD